MSRQLRMIVVSLPLLATLVLFSACSVSRVGTIPSGTPDLGNGTPSVIQTPAPSIQAVTPAPVGTMGLFYAFVRNKQLWVALHGAHPAQMTSFDYSQTPNVFWQTPQWSPGDHYIAFIMNARPVGLGGGGCPGPDYTANGALYLLDTATDHFSRLSVPSVVGNAQASGIPSSDDWQSIFWEDTTHLLAWYNGDNAAGKISETAGLYRYDVTTQVLTQVLPLSALGLATLFNPQKEVPLLLALRYSNEQLFYQVVVHPFEQQSRIVIYRHSITQPGEGSSKLLEEGTEPWCVSPEGGTFVKPGWDVAPDGEQLVAQVIAANGPDQSMSAIQTLNLNDGSTTALFTQVPGQFLGHDLTLTWGPDSQKVVVTTPHFLNQGGPYRATLANPTVMQQFAPGLAGQVVWRPDAAAFALQSADALDMTTSSDVYVFLGEDTHGRMLLTDARDFVWG